MRASNSARPRANSKPRRLGGVPARRACTCPRTWSQVAADILAQKYFRKAGVAKQLKRVEENDVPSWLWRSVPDEKAMKGLSEAERYGSETDSRQVFDRLAGTWTYWGWKGKYFATEDDARAFFDELRFMLATQKVAPNSPQWFNTGLHWAYGIDGPARGISTSTRSPISWYSRRAQLRAPAAACLLHPVGQ